MLRIQQSTSGPVVTIALSGRLLSPWTSEVRVAAANALAHGAVQLDLAALTFADADGIATLLSLRAAGIKFQHSSAFIDSLLQRSTANQ